MIEYDDLAQAAELFRQAAVMFKAAARRPCCNYHGTGGLASLPCGGDEYVAWAGPDEEEPDGTMRDGMRGFTGGKP